MNGPGLTIAELATRTGVGEATLRIWEARYGRPQPRRLANGHRRYAESDVELIEAALGHRRAGLSVAAALGRAQSSSAGPPQSIFVGLRARRPELIPQAMTVRTLGRVSRAIEDECLARASPGLLIGAFQRESFYRRSEPRWRELAAAMEVTFVMADFTRRGGARGAPEEIPFTASSPLAREWGLIGPAGCLLARERPGRAGGEQTRVFDAIWSPEPEVIHAGATIAISLLGDDPLRAPAQAALGPGPPPSSPELRRATELTNRIVGYVAPPGVG